MHAYVHYCFNGCSALILGNSASRSRNLYNKVAIAVSYNLYVACCFVDKLLVPLQGRTPLWLACDAGHADQVEVLLGAGADVDAKSFPHKKYQILMGVSIFQQSSNCYVVALGTAWLSGDCHIACRLLYCLSDHVSCAAVVCAHECLLWHMQGSTALHQAAMHGHAKVVHSLLEYGADANARTADVKQSSLTAVTIQPAGCMSLHAQLEHCLSDQ